MKWCGTIQLMSLTWVERKLLLCLSRVRVPNNCGLCEGDFYYICIYIYNTHTHIDIIYHTHTSGLFIPARQQHMCWRWHHVLLLFSTLDGNVEQYPKIFVVVLWQDESIWFLMKMHFAHMSVLHIGEGLTCIYILRAVNDICTGLSVVYNYGCKWRSFSLFIIIIVLFLK